MSQTATFALLAFTVKLVAVVWLGQALRRSLGSLLESMVAAWVTVQLTLTIGLLALSAFHAVRGPAVWCLLLAVCGTCAWAVVRTGTTVVAGHDWKTLASRAAMLSGLGILSVFGFLAFRSFLFSDNTWDAVTYELPRIAFWAKHQTLFVHQPTDAINIFANEWNGELNALFYVTASGHEMAATFGNVDVWFFACLSLAWLARVFGAPPRLALVCGLVLTTTPMILGLAMTVKGDLLSIASMVAAVGFVVECLRHAPTATRFAWRPAFVLGAAGLAAGAKIVVLPTAIPLAALLLVWYGFTRRDTRSFKVVAVGLVAFVAGCARYLVNRFQFGDWFVRADKEGTVGFGTLIGNLAGILKGCFDVFSAGVNPPFFLALSGGLGFLGVALIVWLGVGLGARDASPSRGVLINSRRLHSFAPQVWLLAVPLCAGWVVALFAIPWQPWSLRYFGAWLMVALTSLLAAPFRFVSARLTKSTILFWVLLMGANMWLTFGTLGEGIPISFGEALHQTQNERKFAGFPYFYSGDAGLKGITFESPRDLRILVSNRVNSAIYPFFGENYRHDVELVDTTNRLEDRISRNRYDLVVFSGPPRDDEREVHSLLERQGYMRKIDSSFWRVYSPRLPR